MAVCPMSIGVVAVPIATVEKIIATLPVFMPCGHEEGAIDSGSWDSNYIYAQ